MRKPIRALTLLLFLGMPGNDLYAKQQPSRQALDEWIRTAEERVVGAADAMPAEKYSFAPTNGEFAGVRTFAEQVKHVAAANFGLSARIAGKKPSSSEASETGPASMTGKADIVEYLRASFAALHQEVAKLDDSTADTVLKGEGHTPAWYAIDAIAHSLNHYGQMVEYLRMNGIVPPASR